MFRLIIILQLFVLVACANREQKVTAPQTEPIKKDSSVESNKIVYTPAEDSVIKALRKVPEIKSFCDEEDRDSTKGIHGSIYIVSKPNEKEPYYSVQVGEDNPQQFRVQYTFFVYYPSLKIEYFDFALNKAISLKEWRRESVNP